MKNLSGDLYFDKDFNQLTVIKRNGKRRRKNPVLQARLQAKKLKLWLEEHNCPEIPIHYLFVNSNESSELRTDSENTQLIRNICNSEVLMDKIDQTANYYTAEKLEAKELRKIKRLLIANHTPENPDILLQFNISPKEILLGVQCPKCKAIPMKYKYGTWICPKCNMKSKTAHIQMINDYFLLVKPFITNGELRKLLHIDSIKVANKILTSMNLPITGKYKDRAYHQPPIQ